MHRALTAMGGLPRRAPASATIALLTPPAPPQSGSGPKKPSAQGAAAGHKCSRCKSRPKSGSGSSLCIRCKLQRDYGSPRGGFAAPRKKLPPPPSISSGPTVLAATPANTAPTSAASIACNVVVPPEEPLPVATSSSSPEALLETVQVDIAGEKLLQVNTSSLRLHRNLTESDWPKLKEELENERDDFRPEDLDRTMEVDYLDNQGLPMNVDLPAEIIGTIEATGTSAPQVEAPVPSVPVVSLPEPEKIPPPELPQEHKSSKPDLLSDARHAVQLYGEHLSAAFDALHSSTSQAKWVSVLSVYQKKAVLAKILSRLSHLERLLLLPEERNVVSRISRSAEQLFNSMSLIRGQMHPPVNAASSSSPQSSTGSISSSSGPPMGSSENTLVSNHSSNSPFSVVSSAGVATAQDTLYQPQHCLQQPFYYGNVPVQSLDPVQTTRSLKEEADEEIKKILAKLQSEDRSCIPGVPQNATMMIYDECKLNGSLSSTVNSRLYATSYTGLQQNDPTYTVQQTYVTNRQVNCQYDQLGQWAQPSPNPESSSVNRVVLNSGALVTTPVVGDQFSPPVSKRAFINGSSNQQISSGSMVSAPQLRNLLARKVTPISPGIRATGQQGLCFFGTGRVNHAQENSQSQSSFISSLDNNKTQLNGSAINSTVQTQTAFSSPTNTYSAVYTNGQIAQYHVQPSQNPLGHVAMDGGPQQADSIQSNLLYLNQQPVDQVISESFTPQWSGSNLGGVFN